MKQMIFYTCLSYKL
uniref:Uncharacterized protein n=1 Tax=Arundo donax TaxID=35708 RepID=A0A0A8Y3N7_ARUDO